MELGHLTGIMTIIVAVVLVIRFIIRIASESEGGIDIGNTQAPPVNNIYSPNETDAKVIITPLPNNEISQKKKPHLHVIEESKEHDEKARILNFNIRNQNVNSKIEAIRILNENSIITKYELINSHHEQQKVRFTIKYIPDEKQTYYTELLLKISNDLNFKQSFAIYFDNEAYSVNLNDIVQYYEANK